jgi:hypothetical protein
MPVAFTRVFRVYKFSPRYCFKKVFVISICSFLGISCSPVYV